MSLRFAPEAPASEARVRQLTKSIVDKEVRATAIEDDARSLFRRPYFTKLAAEGLVSLAVRKEWGGGGYPPSLQYACLEEICRASAALAVVVGVTNLAMGCLLTFGTDEQKRKYVPPMARGEWLGAFSLSEPGAGSDAANLRCAARRGDGGYVVNGNKVWCSSAGHADVYILMARTGEGRGGISAFVVPKDTAGFRVGKQEKKLGLRASSLAELVFENCFLPDPLRLGAEGDGLKVALSQLDAGRITIGVAGVALAMEAIERAWSYFLRQKQAGVTFEDGIRHRLATLFAQTQATRQLVGLAAQARGEGKPITLLASQAKLLGSDLAMEVTSEVVSLMGPEGVRVEAEVERLMRDAKSLQIVEGTNQIQRMVIAREMDGMFT